jgi:hypothetical protein
MRAGASFDPNTIGRITAYADEIVHPTCVKCGTPMWLTRVEADEARKELYTFECQACGNSTAEVVKHG